jgi:hypothetical protein
MFKVDLSNPFESPADKVVQGFEDEIEGYLYGRFGD